jgi:hypothetical protein
MMFMPSYSKDDLGGKVEVPALPNIIDKIISDDPLAVHRRKGVLVKQQLLNDRGQPPLNGQQVAELLALSREAVNKRRRNKQLLAINLGKRDYRYPAWQFQEGKVLTGLKEVLHALDTVGEWSPLIFFCSGDTRLRGETPLERLQRGDISAVVTAARCYGLPNPA